MERAYYFHGRDGEAHEGGSILTFGIAGPYKQRSVSPQFGGVRTTMRLLSRSIPYFPASIIAVLVVAGCAEVPLGPYEFRDRGAVRKGSDSLGVYHYEPGIKDPKLRPPKLIYPDDRATFSHYPRIIIHRWEPAEGTPADAQYFYQSDFVSNDGADGFGDWSKNLEEQSVMRTGKTTLNDRFIGAQPGRWRVKTVAKTGESEWSEWRYFRFTR